MYLCCTYCGAQLKSKCIKMHDALFETGSEPPQASLPDKFRKPELNSEKVKNFLMVLTDYDLRPNIRTLPFFLIHNDFERLPNQRHASCRFSLTGLSTSQQLLLIYWITLTAFHHISLRKKRREKLHYPALKPKRTIRRRTRF